MAALGDLAEDVNGVVSEEAGLSRAALGLYHLDKARGVAVALAGESTVVHGFVAEYCRCIGARLHVVELDGDDLLGGDIRHESGIVALPGAYPVPGVEDELCIIAAGVLHDLPRLAYSGKPAVGHGLDADGVFPGARGGLQALCPGAERRTIIDNDS